MALPSLNNIKKRTLIIVICILVGFGAVLARMVWWQVIKGAELSERAREIQTAGTVEQANRGKITDRNGKVLAESASVKTLVCNPQDIKEHGDLNTCIQTRSPIIGMSESELRG